MTFPNVTLSFEGGVMSASTKEKKIRNIPFLYLFDKNTMTDEKVRVLCRIEVLKF